MKIKALSPQQRKAIQALLSARHVNEAAQASGTAQRTLERWLTDDLFIAELHAAQATALESTIRRMSHLAGLSLDVLCEVMTHGETETLKLHSALGLLRVLPAMRASADFEMRLAALEASPGDGV